VDKYPQSPEAVEAKKALGDLVLAATDPVKLAVALKTAAPAEKAKGTLRLARLYLQAKNNVEAEKALVDLAAQKPEAEIQAEGRYLFGVINEAKGAAGAPAAATALAEALRLDGDATWAADAQVRLAWLYLDLKKPADCERAAAAALALKPEKDLERQARLAQVQAQLDQEKWDSALDGCRALLATNPPPETVATILYTQAWVASKRGKPEDALPLWEKLAADHPKSPYAVEAHVRIADAHFSAQRWEDARRKYAAALAIDPKSVLAPEARYKLGSALYNLDRFPEATAELDAVVAAPNAGDYAPESLYWSGRALEKADKKEEAVKRFERLIAQHAKHTRVADAKLRLAALKALIGK
jgi:TolA-binding protein